MNSGDVEKLLGGYTTGTLTGEERKLLFDAAMRSQTLFDAMADEEELRELLSDPVTRGELLAALDEQLKPAVQGMSKVTPAAGEPSLWQRMSGWLFRPLPMVGFATAALAVVAFVVINRPIEKPAEIASGRVRPPTIEATPTPFPKSPADAVTAVPQPPAPVTEPPVVARRTEPSMPTNEPSQVAPAEEPAQSPNTQQMGERKVQNQQGPQTQKKDQDSLAQGQSQSQQLSQSPGTAGGALVQQAPQRAASPQAKQETSAPISYVFERQQQNGAWVESGQEFTSGDSARIKLISRRSGFLNISSGQGEAVVVPVEAGKTYYYPDSGALPSQRGERTITISLTSTAAKRITGNAALRDMKAKSGLAVAKETDAAAADAGDTQVTIRLHYR